ncbi:MAG TPA: hypothetical protein VNE22_02850 [Acidimicrobiales bacterium]|nr:hypothetical protein [Acidimicrobiales bacterium]
MPVSKRVGGLLIAAVAFALTVTGVVVAATDSNPLGISKDPLALHGFPPKTADVALSLRSGSGVGLSAQLQIDFAKGRVEAHVQFPVIFTSVNEELRLVGGHLYVRGSNVAQGPWLGVPLKAPNFFGVSLEMIKPDIALITGLKKTVAHSGYETIYTFARQSVALNVLGAKGRSTLGSLRWTIITGASGEVVSSTLALASHHRTTTLSMNVLSYNQPARVSAPAAKDVHSLTKGFFTRIMKSVSGSGFMLPNLSQLTTGSVA